MAINERPGPGEGIEEPGPDTSSSAGRADPEGGGCLKLGWGCLPVIAAVLLVPGILLF